MNDRLNLWPQYRAHLVFRRRAANTIRDRERVIRHLAAHAGTDLADIGHAEIMAFLGREQLSTSTLACYRSHLASFYAWAVLEGFLITSPVNRVPTVTPPKGVPRPMRPADFLRALAGAPAPLDGWLRLGGFAGLRCAEMANLTVDNVDLPGRRLYVTGKGSKTRVVPLVDDLLPVFDDMPAAGPVFVHPEGRRYTPTEVSWRLNRYLRRLGIQSTAHKLRHLYATSFLAAGGDLRATQDVLGHASPATTAGYTAVDTGRSYEIAQRITYDAKGA